jgi:hypothetical protein
VKSFGRSPVELVRVKNHLPPEVDFKTAPSECSVNSSRVVTCDLSA